MKSSYMLNCVAVLTAASLSPAVAQLVIPTAPTPRAPVLTESLNSTHQLIGPLDLPLGELLTIAATVHEPRNPGKYKHYVVVTAINGRSLINPIQMPAKLSRSSNVKKLVPGQKLMLRVYQDGGMTGTPEQEINEVVPIESSAYEFNTWLVILNSIDREG